jgi:hypothetical protein
VSVGVIAGAFIERKPVSGVELELDAEMHRV